MLRVRKAAGPAAADVGERVTYRVTRFNQPAPSAAQTAKVSWLIKTPGGTALSQIPHAGPVLELVVPTSWAGQTAMVMPYMRSPSLAISVQTSIGEQHATPEDTDAAVGRDVRIIRENNLFYASVNGEVPFYLGTRVRYQGRCGLMNSGNPPGDPYRPEDYEALYGDWAWYLFPTITCESKGHFTCLNTYDRACFTFGHIQLAAHTPNDNFVVFFRELLRLSSAVEYFPDLTLKSGRIHQRTADGLTPLETATDTTALMAYFNATPGKIDDVEAERAARLVDWSLRHKSMRDLQVGFAVRQQRQKLAAHARKLPLDGAVDKLALVVLDILHQGRGKYTTIAAALRADNPFDALLNIGIASYHERISTLRAAIRDLEARGKVGRSVYDKAARDFLPPDAV